jgi:hypothetical protein
MRNRNYFRSALVRKPTKQNKTKARVKSHLRVQMAAQQSNQKTDSAFPTPSPRRIQQPDDGAQKHDCQINRGDLKQWNNSPCNRDSDLQLNEMLEHNWDCGVCQRWRRERKTRGMETGRTKERRTCSPPGARSPRTGPSNPCTRSGLRAYQTPILYRRGQTDPHLNGCGERETGQGTTNGRTRHTPVLYPKSKTGHETPMMTYFGERTSLVPSFFPVYCFHLDFSFSHQFSPQIGVIYG